MTVERRHATRSIDATDAVPRPLRRQRALAAIRERSTFNHREEQ